MPFFKLAVDTERKYGEPGNAVSEVECSQK